MPHVIHAIASFVRSHSFQNNIRLKDLAIFFQFKSLNCYEVAAISILKLKIRQ